MRVRPTSVAVATLLLAAAPLAACLGEDVSSVPATGPGTTTPEAGSPEAATGSPDASSAADAEADAAVLAGECGLPAGAPETFAASTNASLLTVDASGVFWIDQATKLRTKPLEGGADAGSEELDGPTAPVSQLATSNTHVVWQSVAPTDGYGFAAKTGRPGAAVVPVYNSARGMAVNRNDAFLFFTSPNDDSGIGGMNTICNAGEKCTFGPSTNVAAVKDSRGLALESGSLWFFGADAEGGEVKLWTCPTNDCSGRTSLASSPSPSGLVVRGGVPAWIETSTKTVFAIQGSAKKELWKGSDLPKALAMDDRYAYVLAGGTLYARSLAADCTATIATGQTGAVGVAAHEGVVYWTVPGAVMRRRTK